MFDLYAWPTPHGIKVSVMLEELGLPYNLNLVDLSKRQQQDPEYLKLSPAGKLPLLVDHDESKGSKGKSNEPLVITESGAILLYLAEKAGSLLPKKLADRSRVYEWFMFQFSVIGPTLGQTFYYRKLAKEKNQETVDRVTNEAVRVLQSLELHFKDHPYLAGDYSIADIATFPWIKSLDRLEFNIEKLENLCRWRDTISKRPAVEKGVQRFKEKAAA